MRAFYFDKAGQPLTLEQFAPLFDNMKYRRIGEDELPNGFWVSTVWLGVDHGVGGDGPPIVFETMVFRRARDGVEGGDMDQIRYTTEAEARAGHAATVEKWRHRPVDASPYPEHD